MIINYKEYLLAKRLGILGVSIFLLFFPPTLNWGKKFYRIIRVLSPVIGITLAGYCINQSKQWEKEEEIDAMNWSGKLYQQERIIEATLVTDVPQQNELKLLPARVENQNVYGIPVFDWNRFATETDRFPHIRVIAETGYGKTTLVDWLVDIFGGESMVITPKMKPHNWQGLDVFGCRIGNFFRYDEIRVKLEYLHQLMINRYNNEISYGESPQMVNVVLDEWRLIRKNIKEIKDKKTKEILNHSADTIMRELITVAREANIRLICLAQGEQVETWGLQGESALKECFTDIRLGEFATEHANRLRNRMPEHEWQRLMQYLEKQIRPCMVGDVFAVVPDLSNWKRV